MFTVFVSKVFAELFSKSDRSPVPSFPRSLVPPRAFKKLDKLKMTDQTNNFLLSVKFCGAFLKATVPPFPRSSRSLVPHIIERKNTMLPTKIYTGKSRGGHIQGIAIDRERKYIYCSFTTELLKLDLEGNLIGSVKGLTGHLGCLAYNYDDGKVYASLEYKNDSIGRGILSRLGIEGENKDAFYIAIFDVNKIDRVGMDASADGVMMTAHLHEVLADYHANVNTDEKVCAHRHGCSGIDGITFAPSFDDKKENRLLVSYGVFGDVSRDDNDYQVILQYDIDEINATAQPLSPKNVHESGPEKPTEKYFVYTGNTVFGVQNMEYDPELNRIFLAVYCGKKENFPNFPFFAIDCKKAPQGAEILGNTGLVGKTLSLADDGLFEKGIYGYRFPLGSTGMASLGGGYFYFSEPSSENGENFSNICLYKYTGNSEKLFEKFK